MCIVVGVADLEMLCQELEQEDRKKEGKRERKKKRCILLVIILMSVLILHPVSFLKVTTNQ